MTLLISVVLIIGVFLWRVNSSWDWSIPIKLEEKIVTWKEGLVSRTHTLNYDWYANQETQELEKTLWELKLLFPRLRKKIMAPIKAQVSIRPNISEDHRHERYIACLQRRFPEISISESVLSSETRDEGKDLLSRI